MTMMNLKQNEVYEGRVCIHDTNTGVGQLRVPGTTNFYNFIDLSYTDLNGAYVAFIALNNGLVKIVEVL